MGIYLKYFYLYMSKKNRKKYTKQNIRKRKKDRTTKKKKHKRIEGSSMRTSMRRTTSRIELNPNSQIEFEYCDDILTDNCVIMKRPWGIFIKFNGEKYIKTATKINGGHGRIYIFESEKNNKLAVKTFIHERYYEEEKNIAEIINTLIRNNEEDRFCVVPTYYHDDLEIIIMHYKNFNITTLLREKMNLQDSVKIKIYKDVVKCIKNLLMEGLFYGDLKFENILIQHSLSSRYKVYLGDIGSIAYIPHIIRNKNIEQGETISKQIVFTVPYKDIKNQTTHEIFDIDNETFDIDNEFLSIEQEYLILCSFFHQILSFFVMLILYNTTIDKSILFYDNEDWKHISRVKIEIMKELEDRMIIQCDSASIFKNFFFPDFDDFINEWKRRLMIAKHDNDVEEKQNSEGEIRKQAIKSILEDFEALNIPLYEDEG